MTPEEQKQLIATIGEKFIARKDVKAKQFSNGSGYQPVRVKDDVTGEEVEVPFKMSDFKAHLAGDATYGHYVVNKEGQCKLFAFDIDLRKIQPDPDKEGYWVEWNSKNEYYDQRAIWAKQTPGEELDACRVILRCMAEGLAYKIERLTKGKIHVAIANSGGKGLHVYGFTGLQDASKVRALALKILADGDQFEAVRGNNFFRHRYAYPALDIEVFPKQENLDGKEFGNLLALPLGVHQGTKMRKYFMKFHGDYEAPFEMLDPMVALTVPGSWRPAEEKEEASTNE